MQTQARVLAGLLLLMIAASPCSGQAFVLPPICREKPPELGLGSEPDTAYDRALRLLGLRDHLDGSTRSSIDSLWRADSSAVEWELAMIVSMESISNETQALVAADFYLKRSGRGQPMLGVVPYYSTGTRWWMALGARKLPVSENEEKAVLVVACQAYWLLESVERDSLDKKVLEHWTGNTQLIRSESVVRGSAQLLTGVRRQEVQRWIAELKL